MMSSLSAVEDHAQWNPWKSLYSIATFTPVRRQVRHVHPQILRVHESAGNLTELQSFPVSGRIVGTE